MSDGCRCEGGCERDAVGPGSLCSDCQKGGCKPVGPRRWLDRLMWRLDEDNEWAHRFEKEWNGDAGTTLWSNYVDETRDTELARVVTWTNWSFGPSFETGLESIWVRDGGWQEGHRVSCRRTFWGFSLGPLHFQLMVVRPRKGFSP